VVATFSFLAALVSLALLALGPRAPKEATVATVAGLFIVAPFLRNDEEVRGEEVGWGAGGEEVGWGAGGEVRGVVDELTPATSGWRSLSFVWEFNPAPELGIAKKWIRDDDDDHLVGGRGHGQADHVKK
jgi:hypothetical protein